jgi:NitT/TauT family transport system substrate-binding protein
MTDSKLAVDPVSLYKSAQLERWGRRDFVKGLGALAGSAGLLGFDPRLAAAEPPPETTKLKIWAGPLTCVAPQYIAQEQLLQGEGFTDVRFVTYPSDTPNWPPQALLAGEADFGFSFPPTDIVHIEAGAPVVVLGGSPMGCVEVVAGNTIRLSRFPNCEPTSKFSFPCSLRT